MLFFRKVIFKILILFTFAVLNTMAQTPFNAPFGFFGAGQSNGSTPVLTFTAPTNLLAITTANQASVTAAGTCSITGRLITLTIGATTLGTVTCSAGRTFSTTVDLTAIADGVKTITASMTNVVGVTGTTTVNVDKDVTGPMITILSGGGYPGGTNSPVNFTVTELHATTSNYTLQVSSDSGSTWSALGTVTGTAGALNNQAFAYAWNTVPNVNLTTYKLKISATDSYGNSTTQISSLFAVDSVLPTIGAGGFSINSGAGSTMNTTISLALTGSDSLTNITQFCFKHTVTTQPTLADGCWTSVTSTPPNLVAATTLNLSNFPFILPPVFGTYDIYAWVRDATGNISALSNSGAGTTGLDKATITYVPPIPATVIDVMAVSSDAPSNPLNATDLTLPAGSSVFIKWNATDDKVLPATPVSLYYTTDDVTYTLIANNITNSANTGCTISGSQTGCYKWVSGSPLSTYYHVRVAVLDSDGSTSASSSGALNVTTTFNLLAGNTDPGNGGSANAATFGNTNTGATYVDPRSFAITSTGVLYFIDDKRGLLKVDPANGTQQLLIKETGVSAGDGLAITNPGVTLNGSNQVIVDFQDNVYVFEYLKIRKIDMSVSPPVISTIVGGGVSTADNILGTALQIGGLSKTNDYAAPFFATPDGKIYFRSDVQTNPLGVNGKFRYYDPATGKVFIKHALSGTRNVNGTDRDITLCGWGPSNFGFDPATYVVNDGMMMVIDRGLGDANCPGTSSGYMAEIDPSTGVILPPPAITSMPGGNGAGTMLYTGMDGKIYGAGRGAGRIFRWNQVAKTWTTLLGTGVRGFCADGTLATSCAVDVLDIFVNKNGGLYFIDRGRVRMVDSATNKVYTLYGQGLSSGDGGNPLSARFNLIGNVKSWSNSGTDTFVIVDPNELRIREFVPGGTVQTLAGNGTAAIPDTTNPANAQSMNVMNSSASSLFVLHPTNGTLYTSRNYNLAYLNRGTGKWVDLVGTGSNKFYQPATDGMLGNQITFFESGAGVPVVFDMTASGQILAGNYTYGIPSTNSVLKLYDSADGKQSPFMGVPGTVASAYYFCADGTAAASCDVPYTGLMMPVYDSYTNKFFISSTAYGPTQIKQVTVGGNLNHYRTLPKTINNFAYHRNAGLTQEWFYYCQVNGKLFKYNNLTAVETAINMPSTAMTCTGRGIYYSETRNSLVFGFSQNGLGGVAEIPNP